MLLESVCFFVFSSPFTRLAHVGTSVFLKVIWVEKPRYGMSEASHQVIFPGDKVAIDEDVNTSLGQVHRAQFDYW